MGKQSSSVSIEIATHKRLVNYAWQYGIVSSVLYGVIKDLEQGVPVNEVLTSAKNTLELLDKPIHP